jgi:aminoglycoside/choline kinase family phosphotransferase
MPKTIGIIDFQDGVHGACAYDLASLGQDARVDVSVELEHALIQAYAKVRLAQENPFHMVHFMEDYAVLGAQRATKILGIFSRLQLRDNKPHYKAHQPRVWGYLKRNLQHNALADYKAWLIDTGLYAGLDKKFGV